MLVLRYVTVVQWSPRRIIYDQKSSWGLPVLSIWMEFTSSTLDHFSKYFGGEALTWGVINLVYKDIEADKFTFLEPIKDKKILYNKHKTIFKILANVNKAICTKDASKEVLDNAAKECIKFGENFPVMFPEETISRKQHVFVFVLPIFEKRYML